MKSVLSYSMAALVCLGFTLLAIGGASGRNVDAAPVEGMRLGSLLDQILYPKIISDIESRSQWTDRRIVVSGSEHAPAVLVPVYCDIEGVFEPDDAVYYVLNLQDDGFSGFGDEGGLSYWQGADARFVGPLDADATPFAVELPLDGLWENAVAPADVFIHALVGARQVYATAHHLYAASRIYYTLRSSEDPPLRVSVVRNDAVTGTSGLPAGLALEMTPGTVWLGRADDRQIVSASLAFDGERRIPGQPEGTARFSPDPGIYVDLPVTAALQNEGLVDAGADGFFLLQVAGTLDRLVEEGEQQAKTMWETRPGELLSDTVFLVVHLFERAADGTLTPIESPLSKGIHVRMDDVQPDPATLAGKTVDLWHYPLLLDADGFAYRLPEEGAWTKVEDGALALDEYTLSIWSPITGVLAALVTDAPPGEGEDDDEDTVEGESEGEGEEEETPPVPTTVDLERIPLNYAAPMTLRGDFSNWLDDAAISLSAATAEDRYDVYIGVGDEPATFIAPDGGAEAHPDEGIVATDDPDSPHAAYLWTPALITLPEAPDALVPLRVYDTRTSELVAEIELARARFATVATLRPLTVPPSANGVVYLDPPHGSLRRQDAEAVALPDAHFLEGDAVAMTAVPAQSFLYYRILLDGVARQVSRPEYTVQVATGLDVSALFEEEVFHLDVAVSELGHVTASPVSSPGLPEGWYERDASVTLTATPIAQGARFVLWTDDLMGDVDNPRELIMTGHIRVGALFLPEDSVALFVDPGEHGRVAFSRQDMDTASAPLYHVVARNSSVALTCLPDDGFRFDTWRVRSGDDEPSTSTANPLTLVCDRDRSVAVDYVQVFRLTVTAAPEDGGEVRVDPAQPAVGYDVGTVVTLNALPRVDEGYHFVQWIGANAFGVRPNTTTAQVSLTMDAEKTLAARFTKLTITAIEPEEAWMFGGVVTRITGEALTDDTVILFGDQEAPLFDVAPSGTRAYALTPPVTNLDGDERRISLAIRKGDMTARYAPGFVYRRRLVEDNVCTVAFSLDTPDAPTTVQIGDFAEGNAQIVVPALNRAPVYGIVRLATPGNSAASRAEAAEVMPGASVPGMYDLSMHFFAPPSDPYPVAQYGRMYHDDITRDTAVFSHPYASPFFVREGAPLLLSMSLLPEASPDLVTVRSGLTLWGVAAHYNYLNRLETLTQSVPGLGGATVTPVFQSTLLAREATPEPALTRPDTDTLTAIAGVRVYGGRDAHQANVFTWRKGAILPEASRRRISITAVNQQFAAGTGSGPLAGGTPVTLTSPHGGLGWIDAVELRGRNGGMGGIVPGASLITAPGASEFTLEFQTPPSDRAGWVDIVVRPAADPGQEIVIARVYEYTRATVRWWIVLLILLGLILSVIGLASN